MIETKFGVAEVVVGGLGVGIGSPTLAQEFAFAAQRQKRPVLPNVSITGAEELVARDLQNGCPKTKSCLEAFPYPDISEWIDREYNPNTPRPSGKKYKPAPRPDFLIKTIPHFREDKQKKFMQFSAFASFALVHMAREGHDCPVLTNRLEDLQALHPSQIAGLVIGGAAGLTEGAGITTQVPGALDRMAQYDPVTYRVKVIGQKEPVEVTFDPQKILGTPSRGLNLKRPDFYAIASSSTLARWILAKSNGRVDAIIFEHHSAGGHNAPPIGSNEINPITGEYIYGPKDEFDFDKLKEILKGTPFILAGGWGTPQGLVKAKNIGAAGVQIGSQPALCIYSGMRSDLREAVIQAGIEGTLIVRALPRISPTGYPFQVAILPGTLADPEVYNARERSCSIRHLLKPAAVEDGCKLRCPAMPLNEYRLAEGLDKDTVDVACLCNGLLSTAGRPQIFYNKKGEVVYVEPPIATVGKSAVELFKRAPYNKGAFTPEDIIIDMYSGAPEAAYHAKG